MAQNNLPFDLEKEIGKIKDADEWNPGVYHIDAYGSGLFEKEYFVVLDSAPMADKVHHYGKKLEGLRLFDLDDDSSGWRIVQYEISKYSIKVKKRPVPEEMFRDISLHAAELHPEYFGAFPVPFHTPCGYTLRHRTLANGIYWLETSECEELLAVCYPIWDAELSNKAQALGQTAHSREHGQEETSECLFFPARSSCIPLYELMETRREWDGTVIRRPALMNAIWEYLPEYALVQNSREQSGENGLLAWLSKEFGLESLSLPAEKRMICMYPDAGTDFLLLK